VQKKHNSDFSCRYRKKTKQENSKDEPKWRRSSLLREFVRHESTRHSYSLSQYEHCICLHGYGEWRHSANQCIVNARDYIVSDSGCAWQHGRALSVDQKLLSTANNVVRRRDCRLKWLREHAYLVLSFSLYVFYFPYYNLLFADSYNVSCKRYINILISHSPTNLRNCLSKRPIVGIGSLWHHRLLDIGRGLSYQYLSPVSQISIGLYRDNFKMSWYVL